MCYASRRGGKLPLPLEFGGEDANKRQLPKCGSVRDTSGRPAVQPIDDQALFLHLFSLARDAP